MQKKKAKNPQPNLFSILDNGDIATNNPSEETDKVNETQEPLPYVVKTQINTARMISRNPIEWARYLSFERRVHKDNSKEDVNFFANGGIKESSRVYEANEEGFERRITKRYDLIDTIRNKEFFSKEIDTLTYTNSLEELKEQGLEIQLTHHHETHKKTLENGNEIAKEYDYLKDIYQEVERTKDGELVREIIPSISSAECFKLYDKLPFESINNENTKLNTNGNEEVKKLEFELAKEVHTLILEQQLLSATNYYSWIDKDDYASFAWKMHRLINENKLKENHLSTDNANKIKQFFFNNGFILGWTKEEQSAIQENRDYSLKSALLSLEEIAQAKIELQKYYESVYVNGDGNKREIKPFKEILRDINNFEKAYKERYNELVNLNEVITQAKEGSNEQQNSNANNNNTNNTIKNTIETNTSIGNNIIQNNDNNNPNLSIADLELEQQNLGEQNGKERTNRSDEPNRTRAGIPQEIHRRSEHGGQQEGVERSSDEELLHQDPSLFIEPREQGGTRGVYRSSDQQAVSEKSHRERDSLHEHVSRGDGVSARADSNGASSQASRMENGARSEEKGDNPNDERGISQTPQSPSYQQNSSRDLGLSLSREQPGQIGRLRLFDHGQMGSLFPTDHENQRSKNDNELDRSSDRTNENGDRSPRQNGSANQESARSERYGIAQGSSNQSVLPLAQSRSHHAGLSAPNGLGNLEENRDQERGLLSNLDHLESLLNAIRNNTIASEPDFRSRLLEAIQDNEPLKDSLVGAQLLKDPTTKIFYDKFQLKISPKKVLEILENRIKKSIETTNETLNAFNALNSQAIDGNAISNSVELNPIQENEIADNSVELNNAQEQTVQEQDTQENAQTTIKQETPTAPTIPLNPKIDFKPSEEVLIKGAKTRYKANIKAIELLKELQAKQEILKGDYYATLKEQETLAQFSGWGGLESYFKKDQRPEEFKELNALLTKDEFRRAYSSTRDAYYTPKLVIDSIYQALDQLGFNNDNHQKEIFEPSLGTGKFIAHAPIEEFLVELAANHYEKQYGDKMTDYQLGNLKEDIKVEHLNGAYEVFIRNNELNELYGIRHKDRAHSYKAPFESLLNKVLNNKDLSVKYAQVDPNDPKKEIFISDEEQSNLARQKAEELKEAFKDWIYKDYARRTHLEQIYNDTFNNSVLKTYDGSQLELEGFNHHISLRPHQKNAIFRTIQDRAVCLDHQVGAGKTLCAIASCMEQKRMGLVNKTLIAVPNHLTKQWGDEFYKAYPNANVLVVDSKDITEKERELLFNQIANNNYDAVIIAHTHLELLSNPRGIIEELKEEELVNAEKNFERQELAYKNNPRETKKPNERAFKNKLDKIRAKYDAILEKQGSHIDISQMGIDNLIVDEAHLFKNLAFETSMEKIAGLGNQQGSNRARDLFIKTRYLHQNNKKIMFLTGTPIANSLSEMYHLQRYLTPDVLKERGLEFFDDWAKTYGEVVNDFELDTSAQSYKMVNRFSKFSDVQGLSTMYRAFADIVSNDDILKHNPHFVPKVYGDKPINVVVKRSEEVAQFIGVADENGKYNEGSIIDRMQKCEGNKSKKGQDNILSCTTDARKVALDYRLIDPNAKVEKEFSKSYAMAENIYENYLETNATKGTQLGFIGLSTPKTHSQKVSLEALDNAHEIENKNPLDEAQELLESLSSYDENGNLIAPSKKELENELKEKEAKSVNLDEEIAKSCSFDVYSDVLRHLVQMGIPQNEIAFIHDAKTEEQKQDLFKKLNRGEVRVLLGSPAKMGVGTNVQERLVATHELDCPWRPDELLQMEGRGIRQGNILHQNDPENFRMKIYRYATEKTYDSRMWQIIETKSKGIEQFRNAHKLGLSELEDFNMGSSNASEMKAEATGNPLIIEEVKLRAEIKNEEAKYKAFNKENYFNEENLKNNSSKLDYLKQELKDLETLQSSVMIPTHTEIKLYDLKNEESKDYELIKVKEVEPLKENASMSEELTHKKLKEQNKQIAEQNKEKLDAIKKQFASNLNDLFFNEERDCKLLEYKGFVVNAYKTKYQVEFSLSPKDNPNIAYSPSNMVYKNDTGNMFSSYNFCGEIKFDGFLKRLDNAITKLPEKIKELENSIEITQENIAKYTRLVEQKPPYPRLEYLQALKWNHKTLIDDLAKMSKDRDYKPVFNLKSQEVLEKMNAEKRASLENESLTITEIENSNKEQEIKGNTKSDDEVKQHIEQVIEKEIGKGAEIISSKEVAITNNVDYYENEEELETTQSRSRR